MTSILLSQARVLNPVYDTDQIADVLITDGIITAVEAPILDRPEDTQVIDCTGLVLGPGLVDLYSHSGEPGFEERETLDSLLKAAIVGGFTRLTLLPDTHPALDHPAQLEWMRTQVCSCSSVQVEYWGALTLGTQGQQMAELAELADGGVIGFADGRPLANPALVRRSLEYAQPFNKPIAFWCCDPDLTSNGVVREGIAALRLGLPNSPAIAETTALAALLECVADIQLPIHIMRVSTARSVELIQAAKARGLSITASTTWLHLLLNVNDIRGYHTSLRVEPPLGNPSDQAALIQGFKDGVLDAIAIDHTPYTYEEKTVAFAESPPGAIGLELALPLLWQAFVTSADWTALALWRSLSTHPALCLQQNPGAIAPGLSAEMTLFDPQQVWQVTPASLQSQSYNTFWLGQEIIGKVVKTWQTGKK
ncbi:MAG: dihydroorotase [Timaviella obliquedivisa GSE-PSE-MK23-08B]|jgi:dihydroorotase|nr:dihydroorotase [Timaviella obliquedivisa GSE-PSE-MK23-08B]